MRHPRQHSTEPDWLPRRRLPRTRLPAGIGRWLLDASSLTRRLQEHCAGRLRVRVLGQDWRRPLHSECRSMGLRQGEWSLVREVHLLCGDTPWVFARTVIPARTLRRRPRLAHLGERPLGAVLFADGAARRGEVEVACLAPGHALHAAATTAVRDAAGTLWGRRSVFRIGRRPLLVTEVFLPGEGPWSDYAGGCGR